MKRNQVVWIVVLFVVILLLSLMVNIPARQALRIIKLPPEVQIQGLKGTVSSGDIEVLAYQGYNLKNVHFDNQPVCLLKASICYRLYSDDHELLVNFEANPLTRRVSITHSKIKLRSQIFENIPKLLVKPRGQFYINIKDLILIEMKLSALTASVQWMDAGIEGEDQIFGNYLANISQHSEQINIRLSDQNSLLSVEGDIDVKWNGRYQLDLKFETSPSLNPSVKSVLELSAKRTGLNRFSIKNSGVLPNKILENLKKIH